MRRAFDWKMVRRRVLRDWRTRPGLFVGMVAFGFFIVLVFEKVLVDAPGEYSVVPRLVVLMYPMVMWHFLQFAQLEFEDQRKRSAVIESLPISRRDRRAARLLAFLLPFLLSWSAMLAFAWRKASPQGLAAEVSSWRAAFLAIYVALVALFLLTEPFAREAPRPRPQKPGD